MEPPAVIHPEKKRRIVPAVPLVPIQGIILFMTPYLLQTDYPAFSPLRRFFRQHPVKFQIGKLT